MPDRVDAVIAALQVVLEEAEKSRRSWWKVRRANRWIKQLPGAWRGRWRHLKLRGDSGGELTCDLFISDVRAVLAYLETNRDEIKAVRAWHLPFSRRTRMPDPGPVDVGFSEINESKPKRGRKSGNQVRLIKG